VKIVVLDGYTLNPGDLNWEGFEKLGDLTVYDRTPSDQIIPRMADAEAVITNKTLITRERLEACPRVRYIGVLATGYNVVDVAAAAERGIPVTNVPAYSTDAVAQFTIALLLELCHHVGSLSERVRNGEWTRCPDFCFWASPLVELAGKTLGVIGFGHIGRAAAQIAVALGMKVLAYDIHQDPARETDGIRYAPLDVLLANADVISLHCPLTADNAGMINAETISKMRDGAMLINASRGPLVNEADLASALLSGKLAGAAADVVSVEPIRADNPLLTAPNMIITPHIAWAPKEARVRLMDIAAGNLKSFLDGDVRNNVWE